MTNSEVELHCFSLTQSVPSSASMDLLKPLVSGSLQLFYLFICLSNLLDKPDSLET